MPFLPLRNCWELSYQLPCSLGTTSTAFFFLFPIPLSSGFQILHQCHCFPERWHTLWSSGLSLQPTHLSPCVQAIPGWPFCVVSSSIITIAVKSMGSAPLMSLLLTSSHWTFGSWLLSNLAEMCLVDNSETLSLSNRHVFLARVLSALTVAQVEVSLRLCLLLTATFLQLPGLCSCLHHCALYSKTSVACVGGLMPPLSDAP